MAQQTAVDFLKDRLESILELYNSEWDKVYQVLEQAKQMEKEQICNAFDKGWKDEMRIGEEYYNETYSK